MTNPSVSVLVPICNVERYLRECLDSLVNQTLKDIEIICLDDGSTDASLAVVEEFARRDPRIVVVSKPNSGYGDSMNKGLDLARGEYVGIVESDDFASVDMFEVMYKAAKKYDVDVVRTNYLAHRTECDPSEDVLVDNLFGCKTGRPFAPMEQKEVFMRQPAIWTGIYRKALLDTEEVRFLPTPGASFQDTAFYFKVFYAASKVLLLKEGYLHYRIDNAGSSVKNQSKVFPICEEYAEVWRYAKRDSRKFDQIKTWIPRQQYNGYTWNLNRLSPEIQPLFFERFAREYGQISEAGLLSKERFDENNWAKISAIVDDPNTYFERAYGAQDIDRSIVLSVGALGYSEAKQEILGASKDLTSHDEMFVVHAESERIVTELREEQLHLGAVRSDSDIVACRSCGLIDPSAMRGSLVRIIGVEGGASGSVVRELVSGQTDANVGVTVNDLGFAVDVEAGAFTTDSHGLASIPQIVANCLLGVPAGYELSANWGALLSAADTADVDFVAAAESLIDMVHALMACGAEYEVKEAVYKGLLPVWSNIRKTYLALPWKVQEEVRSAYLSMADVPALEYVAREDSIAAAAPAISVIVPVFNPGEYLDECVDSILSQDVDSLEVIFVNDGSTDNSLETLKGYAQRDNRIRVISQFNCGAGAARNRGIEAARGRKLAFIDPDDRYPSATVLSSLAQGLDASPYSMCGGSFAILETDGRINTDFPFCQANYRVANEGDVPASEVWSDYGWIRFMYDSAIFDDEDMRFPQLNWYEDPVFFLKAVLKSGGYHEIPNEVYLYRYGYKKTDWTPGRTRDLLRGIASNLRLSYEGGMFEAYALVIQRLDEDYIDALIDNFEDEGVFSQLFEIQDYINRHSIAYRPGYRDWNGRLRVLSRSPDLEKRGEVLVERVAHRVARSGVYSFLQEVVRCLRR